MYTYIVRLRSNRKTSHRRRRICSNYSGETTDIVDNNDIIIIIIGYHLLRDRNEHCCGDIANASKHRRLAGRYPVRSRATTTTYYIPNLCETVHVYIFTSYDWPENNRRSEDCSIVIILCVYNTRCYVYIYIYIYRHAIYSTRSLPAPRRSRIVY